MSVEMPRIVFNILNQEEKAIFSVVLNQMNSKYCDKKKTGENAHIVTRQPCMY